MFETLCAQCCKHWVDKTIRTPGLTVTPFVSLAQADNFITLLLLKVFLSRAFFLCLAVCFCTIPLTGKRVSSSGRRDGSSSVPYLPSPV
jgi:hypothetical protein